MSLPKISRRANVRIDWCLELDDGTFEDYLVDAHIDSGEPAYYGSSYDTSYPATSADIDIVDIFKLVGGQYEPIVMSPFLDGLSAKQSDSLNYLLEEEYNSNMETMWDDEDLPELTSKSPDDYYYEDEFVPEDEIDDFWNHEQS